MALCMLGLWDGKLYALNSSNGDLEWSFATGGKVDSSPAVANGIVYVGSHDGNIYALNASTGMSGYDWELHNSIIWSYNTGSLVMLSSPASLTALFMSAHSTANSTLWTRNRHFQMELPNRLHDSFFSYSSQWHSIFWL